MNLMITGGAGFIGSRFVEMLANQELQNNFNRLVVVDNLTYSGNLNNLQSLILGKKVAFFKADICDQDSISKIMNHNKIDLIVNFAAESHVDRSIESPFEFFRTNVMGTQNLLDLSRKYKIQRFMQVSTDEVYGTIDVGEWNEDSPLLPNSPYSASKASADLATLSYYKTFGVDVCISRSCNNYGPRQFPEKVIPVFINRVLAHKKIPLYGDGKNIREWIHVDDHCRALLRILERGKPGEIYNVSGTVHLENIELARKILEFFDKREEDYIQYTPDRKGHDYRYSLSGKKIMEELNFKPMMDFDDGLQATIKWYIDNPNWFAYK